MDLGLSEEQGLLKNAARDFLEKECPETLVREMEEDERGYTPEFWQKMAAQGWQGIIIPEQYGGTGMTFTDLIVLLEEFGRALVPGPFISTVVLGAMPILEAGTEEQKQQFLPKIATGDLIMTLALTEPSAKWDADGVAMPAKADGESFVLNGTKLFVPDAHVTDYMLVAARTKESANPEDGISLFLVDSKSAGIEFTILKTIALMNWELAVRRRHDPIDAENKTAQMEEKIRRALEGGPMKDYELKQKVHGNRAGIWIYNTAKDNLANEGELLEDKGAKMVWLRQNQEEA